MKKMESLKVLEIGGIPISELWPERSSTILSSFPCSLVELSLTGCNLSDDAFPRDFSNLSSIKRLFLDENPICSLPNCIRDLRRLEVLSFDNCERLESLVGLPKVNWILVSGCRSLKKVTFQPLVGFHTCVGKDYDNLVERQYHYKLEPIDRVDVEMIKLLCNLESMPAVRMQYPFNRKLVPIQRLYEHGIFSTFFVGNEVPGRFSYKSTKSSISFIVPHKIRGLNIFATYARENSNNDSSYSDEYYYDRAITTKVCNKSKGLKWIYGPRVYGIPREGEDMIWLSHWKMENETTLQCGDEVLVSVHTRPHQSMFQLKEFGVELVQEHQNNMMISTQHNTKSDPNYPFVISGDLSWVESKPGTYYLCSSLVYSDEEDTDKEEGQKDEPDYTIGRKRNRLIMDSDEEDTYKEGGQLGILASH